MNIKNTIATINQMQAEGVIQRYAIGNAVELNNNSWEGTNDC